jgi:hypothetical protein
LKNNVVCEYEPVSRWQSGQQRKAAGVRDHWRSRGPIPLPRMISAIEDELDWTLFEHFNARLSTVLSVRPDLNNPFQGKIISLFTIRQFNIVVDQILPMAQHHKGLMHSLLSLSASHILQQKTIDVPRKALDERQDHHYHQAISSLANNASIVHDTPAVAQVVALCIKTIIEGNTQGQHLQHLRAIRARLEDTNTPLETKYREFLEEFLIYHDMSATMTDVRRPLMLGVGTQLPPLPTQKRVFMTVCSGLLEPLTMARELRDRVRERRDQDLVPHVDFRIIFDSKQVDDNMRDAICDKDDVGSEEWLAWHLYRTTFWIYLQRTVSPSMLTPELEYGVEMAISYLKDIGPNSSIQSVLLTPLFIISCAAFLPSHRDFLGKQFDTLEQFSGLGNISPARKVVQKVWELMDGAEAQRNMSWDWERVMSDMVSINITSLFNVLANTIRVINSW